MLSDISRLMSDGGHASRRIFKSLQMLAVLIDDDPLWPTGIMNFQWP
jgi:hypothetical protein